MSASRAVKASAEELSASSAPNPGTPPHLQQQDGQQQDGEEAQQRTAANDDSASTDSKRKPEGKKSPQMAEEDERLKMVLRIKPHLDRRIIEGMLNDREALMEHFAGLGVSADAVIRRAAELGLSEALLRQVRGVAADLAGERPGRPGMPSALGARTCLSCDRVFLSTGPGNRLCMRCRGGDAGLAQF